LTDVIAVVTPVETASIALVKESVVSILKEAVVFMERGLENPPKFMRTSVLMAVKTPAEKASIVIVGGTVAVTIQEEGVTVDPLYVSVQEVREAELIVISIGKVTFIIPF